MIKTKESRSEPATGKHNASVADPRSGSANSTADRALDVLLSFTQERPDLSVSEMAAFLGMARSTLYRYLNSLREYGLVAEDEAGRYQLGPRILQLARIARRNVTILQFATPRMHALRDEFGEIVVLSERIGHEVITLERLESRHLVTLSDVRSQILPWPISATARTLLAYADDAPREELLQHLQPFTPTSQTLATVNALRAELERVRERGYGLSINELENDVSGVAAPVLRDGKCRYALAIAAPTSRLGKGRLSAVAASLYDHARSISEELAMLASG